MPNYSSAYPANTVTNWLGLDSEASYHKKLMTRYQDLEAHGWIDAAFTYKFNSLGFRCADFNLDPAIMFLGCSFTVGVGLPLATIWPEIVAKSMNLRCVNLGQGGGAPDTAFRLASGYIGRVNPKIVVYMQPPDYRFELVSDHGVKHYNVFVKSDSDNQIFKAWAIDGNNNQLNREKNSLAIQMLCNHRRIKFMQFDSTELRGLSTSLARDLAHPGVENHKKMADIITAQL